MQRKEIETLTDLPGTPTAIDSAILKSSHGCRVQVLNSTGEPSQNFPPRYGVGLSHDLYRGCIPTPQVDVQSVHPVHSLQPPSLDEIRKKSESEKLAPLLCILF